MRSATLPSMLTSVCAVAAAQGGPTNEGPPVGEGAPANEGPPISKGAPDTGGLPACVVDPPTPPALPGTAANANRLIIRPARPRITSRPRITWILSGPFAPGYTEPHGG